MLRHFAPILMPILISAIGVVLLVRGLQLPEYSVQNGKDLLFSSSWQNKELASINTGDTGRLEQQWYALRQQIVTHRFDYCDLGWSVLALGISIAVIFGINRVWTLADLRELKTPSSRKLFYVLASIVWLAYIPAHLFWIDYVDSRDDAPFVENMAEPIESSLTAALGIFGLPIILIGVWVATRRRRLPVPIWSPSTAPSLTALAILLALVLAVLVTIGGVVLEPPLVPCGVCTIYLLLCGRAVAVQPQQAIQGRGFEVVQRSPPQQ
jgi:hypothetical protein